MAECVVSVFVHTCEYLNIGRELAEREEEKTEHSESIWCEIKKMCLFKMVFVVINNITDCATM